MSYNFAFGIENVSTETIYLGFPNVDKILPGQKKDLLANPNEQSLERLVKHPSLFIYLTAGKLIRYNVPGKINLTTQQVREDDANLTKVEAEEGIGVGGGASALADLTDVNLSSPAEGEVLIYRSGLWVNELFSGSGFTPLAGTGITVTPTGPDYTFSVADYISATSVNTLVDNVQAVFTQMGEPTGFENRTDSTLSYNPLTNVFTISGTYNIFISGVKYTKTGETTTLTPSAGATYFIKYDSSGVFNVSTSPWNLLTDVPIAYVAFNASATDSYMGEERHGITMDGATHQYLHTVNGARYRSGFAISGYTLNADGTNENTYGVATGTFFDEDITNTVPLLSDGGPYTIFYKTGSGNWAWSTGNSLPILISNNNIQYNLNSGGTWSLAEVTVDDRYLNYYVFATNAVTSGFGIIIVPGQTLYDSLGAAQAAGLSEMSLGTVPFQESIAVAKITYHYSSAAHATGNGRARIDEVLSLVGSTANVTLISTPTNHNNLSSLQGGAADEYYHLTSAEYTYVQNLPTTLNDYVLKAGDTMTGDLIFSGAAVQFDIAYDPAHSEGLVFYDGGEHTLAYYNDNTEVRINLGQEHVARVRNQSGGLIANGKVVYISGSSGSHPLIELASNNNFSSHRTIGVATHDISDNENGYITILGKVNNLNTDGFSAAGVTLWLGTNGDLTETEPTAPAHKVKIGHVVRKHATQGSILVGVDTGLDIGALHDVLISGVASGDLLTWNGSVWTNQYNIADFTTGTTGLQYGSVDCDTINSVYTISHTTVDPTYSVPVVSLYIPTNGATITVQAVTNILSTSFDVVLSEVPNVAGYKIFWHLPEIADAISGTAIVNQQITTIPSHTTTGSGNYNVLFTDTVVYADYDNTIILPASPSTNENHWIVNTYSADITIDGNGVDIIIDGITYSTFELPPNSSVHLHYNASKAKWYVL